MSPTIATIAVAVAVAVAAGAVLSGRPAAAVRSCGGGHGLSFADTGYATCDCFDCFTGGAPGECRPVFSASDSNSRCTVDAVGGNPLMFQAWWLRSNASQAGPGEAQLLTPYRMGYQENTEFEPGRRPPGIGPALEAAIRGLHARAGNAATDGYTVVVGSGCTNLIAAASYAFWKAAGAPARMPWREHAPEYPGYPGWAGLHPQYDFSFVPSSGSGSGSGSHDDGDADDDAEEAIVFNSYPNNPTGELRDINGKYTVHDMVYYWPSIMGPDLKKAAFPIMTFSMSKLTGHAGSRLGWALVKDETIANYMGEFIDHVSLGVSIDSQYRALRLLQSLDSDGPSGSKEFFGFMRTQFVTRWKMLQAAFGNTTRFTIESRPNTFYAWIKCNQPQDAPCHTTLERVLGVQGWPGSAFGATDAYTRLELVQHAATFQVLIDNIKRAMAT